MLYFIEFGCPLGSSKHQARFYLGYCDDNRLQERFQEHLRGQGAAITRAAVNKGYGLSIVLTLPGTREDERRLKKQKNHRKVIEQIRRNNQHA